MYLFVYGSLRYGCFNNWRLDNSTYMGLATTQEEFYMVGQKSKSYPFCSKTQILPDTTPTQIVGEIYDVLPSALAPLDVMEGHPHKYTRQPILCTDGTTAEMYVLQNPEVIKEIRTSGRFVPVEHGDWVKFSQSEVEG